MRTPRQFSFSPIFDIDFSRSTTNPILMSTPTREEKAWMSKVSKLLMNPPSDRIGLFTTGDRSITVYDSSFDAEIERLQDRNQDFCQAVNNLDAELGCIDSAVNVHSTAG